VWWVEKKWIPVGEIYLNVLGTGEVAPAVCLGGCTCPCQRVLTAEAYATRAACFRLHESMIEPIEERRVLHNVPGMKA
jgi:hypothetical protein